MSDAQNKLLKNWTESAENYSSLIHQELKSPESQAWMRLLQSNFPAQDNLDILDVGTGPGFFPLLLAPLGHQMTAIDCTEAMVLAAKNNTLSAGIAVDVQLANSHALPFSDDAFDVIISRNVAWTLFDAECAYREWLRVLRPGGKVIIFDANWNRYLFNEELNRLNDEDIANYTREFGQAPAGYTSEMIDYRKSMPMCQRVRPHWDLGALLDVGFSQVNCCANINQRVYDKKRQVLYRSTPMFMITAIKS